MHCGPAQRRYPKGSDIALIDRRNIPFFHGMMVEATDMRKLSRYARHERRVQVIRLRKSGQTYEQIALQTGLSKTGVFDICKRHGVAGAPALRDAPHGRKRGDGRLQDATQEALLQAHCGQDPGLVEDALRAMNTRGRGRTH